ncbi:MAG: hypothetical protein ACOX6J_02685, partial [Oscillospiraceae bacterium]
MSTKDTEDRRGRKPSEKDNDILSSFVEDDDSPKYTSYDDTGTTDLESIFGGSLPKDAPKEPEKNSEPDDVDMDDTVEIEDAADSADTEEPGSS